MRGHYLTATVLLVPIQHPMKKEVDVIGAVDAMDSFTSRHDQNSGLKTRVVIHEESLSEKAGSYGLWN